MLTVEYEIEDKNSRPTTGRQDLFDGDPAFPLRSRVDHDPYGSVKATNDDAAILQISSDSGAQVRIDASRGRRAQEITHDAMNNSTRYALYSGYVATIETKEPKSKTVIKQ